MTATVWCDASQVRDLPYSYWLLASWGLGLAVAFLLYATRHRTGRNGWVSAGFGIMSVPAWIVILGVSGDWIRVVCDELNVGIIVSGPPPQPPAALQFFHQAVRMILQDVGYVLLGALVVVHGTDPTLWRAPTVPRIAGALRGLLPMGRGELASLRWGIAVFPLLALANLGLIWLTQALKNPELAAATPAPTSHYINMTGPVALLLALAAGVGEELVYRGVMQQGILRLLWPRIGYLGAAAAAIALQSIPFAFAHANYNDPQLLLFAFLFAVFAGAVAQVWGIWAAIALHTLIDFYAFYVAVPAPEPLFVALAWTIGAAVLAVAAWQVKPLVTRRASPPSDGL